MGSIGIEWGLWSKLMSAECSSNVLSLFCRSQFRECGQVRVTSYEQAMWVPSLMFRSCTSLPEFVTLRSMSCTMGGADQFHINVSAYLCHFGYSFGNFARMRFRVSQVSQVRLLGILFDLANSLSLKTSPTNAEFIAVHSTWFYSLADPNLLFQFHHVSPLWRVVAVILWCSSSVINGQRWWQNLSTSEDCPQRRFKGDFRCIWSSSGLEQIKREGIVSLCATIKVLLVRVVFATFLQRLNGFIPVYWISFITIPNSRTNWVRLK